MLHAFLRREDLVINKKRTYRLYTDLGMQLRTKRRKKLVRPRIPKEVPTRTNQRWSLDFVHDQLANGRRIRIMNIVDDGFDKLTSWDRESVASSFKLLPYSIRGTH